MNRVERHIIVYNRNLDNLCFLSKNLYNYCNFLIRQEFINNHKLLSEYELTSKLAGEKQIDYIALPAQTSQQIVKLLFKNWKSFFKLCKVKDKLNGNPKLPKYKDKNADTNGAIGILIKVTDEKFKDLIVSRDDVVSPIRLNV
jgi:putative transposase